MKGHSEMGRNRHYPMIQRTKRESLSSGANAGHSCSLFVPWCVLCETSAVTERGKDFASSGRNLAEKQPGASMGVLFDLVHCS